MPPPDEDLTLVDSLDFPREKSRERTRERSRRRSRERGRQRKESGTFKGTPMRDFMTYTTGKGISYGTHPWYQEWLNREKLKAKRRELNIDRERRVNNTSKGNGGHENEEAIKKELETVKEELKRTEDAFLIQDMILQHELSKAQKKLEQQRSSAEARQN